MNVKNCKLIKILSLTKTKSPMIINLKLIFIEWSNNLVYQIDLNLMIKTKTVSRIYTNYTKINIYKLTMKKYRHI